VLRQREVDAYDASIAYLDSEIGRMLEELSGRGLLENTLVIVVGDHGEQIGEHGQFGHGNTVYRQALEVPFIFSFPARIPRGLVVSQPVSLRDLPETVLELVALPDSARLPGQTLTRFWDPALRSQSAVALPLFSELRKYFSIVAADKHYIRERSGRELLYDLADSNEVLNLAAQGDSTRLLSPFRGILDSIQADSSAKRWRPGTRLSAAGPRP
jgi:arylsulfatase A-like enzyme